MRFFQIDGQQRPIEHVDIALELEKHARGYFWAEHGRHVLEIHGVKEGGHWCEIKDERSVAKDAIGPDGPGLVNSWDGGGEPYLLRGACALPQALAMEVIQAFVRDGSYSSAVRWGHGVVRDSWGWVWRAPQGFVEYKEVKRLKKLGGGGLSFAFVEPIPSEHGQGPVWNAITEVEVFFGDGLTFIAHHPMEDLRSLIFEGDDPPLSLGSLQALLDSHPALEELTISAPVAAQLARLSAPRLRRLRVVRGEGVSNAEARRMTEEVQTLRREQWHLPALQAFDVGEDDEDGDEELDDEETGDSDEESDESE